jgi:Tfp pilus assembly protein FimT
MPGTYQVIASQTLSSSAASLSFTSIPATYTDLRLVTTGKSTVSGHSSYIGFNNTGNTGLYSYQSLRSSAAAGTVTSGGNADTNYIAFLDDQLTGSSSTYPRIETADIFSYAGGTYKSVLVSSSGNYNGTGSILYEIGIWLQTAAITSIEITRNAGSYDVGFVATLYGIKAA